MNRRVMAADGRRDMRRQDDEVCDPWKEIAVGLRSEARAAVRQANAIDKSRQAVDRAERAYKRQVSRLFTAPQLRRYTELVAKSQKTRVRLQNELSNEAGVQKLAAHRARSRQEIAEFLRSAGVDARALRARKQQLVRAVAAAVVPVWAAPAQRSE
jgi:hypothetical protein